MAGDPVRIRAKADDLLEEDGYSSLTQTGGFLVAVVAVLGGLGGAFQILGILVPAMVIALIAAGVFMTVFCYMGLEMRRLRKHRESLRQVRDSERNFEQIVADVRLERDAAQQALNRYVMQVEVRHQAQEAVQVILAQRKETKKEL